MLEIRKQLEETIPVIREYYDGTPLIGMILGTGLGKVAEAIHTEVEISYEKLPHFAVSTVESHAGKLLFGELSGVPVMAMQGRFHYYEGWNMKQITYPVRVMKALGAKVLFVSNAAGALNPLFRPSDIMIITDHINLIGDNPLIGPNDDELGPRFPDMSDAYTKQLRELAEQTALELGIRVVQGVYVPVAGPNLETPAEYRFLRIIGGDAVGMSTAPEVIVAVHSGMKVIGFSIITDMCLPDALEPITLEQILATADKADKKMAELTKKLIPKIAEKVS
ncbi:purine-nucleoside phosphorylase [bacterium]|nr:MAG: purine-nucleoside phosphorylase [bacterium]